MALGIVTVLQLYMMRPGSGKQSLPGLHMFEAPAAVGKSAEPITNCQWCVVCSRAVQQYMCSLYAQEVGRWCATHVAPKV